MAHSQINEKANKATGNKRVGVSGQSMKKPHPWVSGNLYQVTCCSLYCWMVGKKEANSEVTAQTPEARSGSQSKWMILWNKNPSRASKHKDTIRSLGNLWAASCENPGKHYYTPACTWTLPQASSSARCQRRDMGPGGPSLTSYHGKLT